MCCIHNDMSIFQYLFLKDYLIFKFITKYLLNPSKKSVYTINYEDALFKAFLSALTPNMCLDISRIWTNTSEIITSKIIVMPSWLNQLLNKCIYIRQQE